MVTHCACGCGQTFTPGASTIARAHKAGITVFFIHGHNTRGARNTRWRGGVQIILGYKYIRMPDHPNADRRGYIPEHRYLVSQLLGRPLAKNEVVHHRNGDRLDNRIENLELLTEKQHKRLHWSGRHNPRSSGDPIPKVCPTCQRTFVASYRNHRRAMYCSNACKHIGLKGKPQKRKR